MLIKITVNSKKELAEILLSGRVLQTRGRTKIYFDADNEFGPFVATYPNGDSCKMYKIWYETEFYEEVRWEEELKKRRILCWVSDQPNPSREKLYMLIERYEDRMYVDCHGDCWKYATPVERDAEELL